MVGGSERRYAGRQSLAVNDSMSQRRVSANAAQRRVKSRCSADQMICGSANAVRVGELWGKSNIWVAGMFEVLL